MKRNSTVQAKVLDRSKFFKFKKTGDAFNAFIISWKMVYEQDKLPDYPTAIDGAIYAAKFIHALSGVSDRLLTVASAQPAHKSQGLVNLLNRLDEFKGMDLEARKDVFALSPLWDFRAFEYLDILEEKSRLHDPNLTLAMRVANGKDHDLITLSFLCTIVNTILDF